MSSCKFFCFSADLPGAREVRRRAAPPGRKIAKPFPKTENVNESPDGVAPEAGKHNDVEMDGAAAAHGKLDAGVEPRLLIHRRPAFIAKLVYSGFTTSVGYRNCK